MEQKFRFHSLGLFTVRMAYGCSIKQLKAILGRKKATYLQDIGEGYDRRTYPIRRDKDGSIRIGCMTFTKEDVAEVKKWLHSVKAKG